MARRRNRKQPKRIDAAYAAMRPMGFEDRTVKKSVDKLLKVYGEQDEGWYFIEEASYKLLIDTLIEGDGESEPLLAITGGDGASSSRAGPSSLPLVCHPAAENYEVDGTSSLPLLCHPAAENYEVDGPSSLPLVFHPAAEGECVVNYEEDIEDYLKEDVENYVEQGVEDYVEEDVDNYMEEDVDDKEAVVSLADIYDKCYALENGPQPQGNYAQAQPEPLQVESPPRKPCYGWISDGSDDEEFISLPPEDDDDEDSEDDEDNEDN